MKDLLLLNAVSQKDEKPHTGTLGLDDTAIPHIKIQITEIPHIKIQITEIPLEKKSSILQYRNPHFTLFVESVGGPEQGIDAALQILLINQS